VENNKNCSVEGCTNTRGKQQKLLGRRMHQHPYPDVRLALHAGIQAFGALERFERGEGFRVRSNRRRGFASRYTQPFSRRRRRRRRVFTYGRRRSGFLPISTRGAP
jgi:hypothetical protein